MKRKATLFPLVLTPFFMLAGTFAITEATTFTFGGLMLFNLGVLVMGVVIAAFVEYVD